MITTPRLSVIIPWRNRNELSEALAGNEFWLKSSLVDVLLVNCGGDANELQNMLDRAPQISIRVIDLPAARFNKSLTLNIGIFFSQAPTIFVLDADIILQSNPLTELLPLIGPDTFITLARVWESKKTPPLWRPENNGNHGDFIQAMKETHTIEFSWADGKSTAITAYRFDICNEWRAGPGIIMVNRDNLINVGGYNSELELWGWEDNDVEVRLRRIRSLRHIDVGEALHLSHGDEIRALDGKTVKQSDWENLMTVCKRYSEGNFFGTYSSDISSWSHRVTQIDRTKIHGKLEPK